MPVAGFNRPGDGGTGLGLTQKLSLVNAIGLPATMADSFQTLVNRVSNKKRWASGTATSDANGKLTVTGLAFQPSYIMAFYGSYRMYYDKDKSTTINDVINSTSLTTGTATITPNSFTLSAGNASTNYSWIAFE